MSMQTLAKPRLHGDDRDHRDQEIYDDHKDGLGVRQIARKRGLTTRAVNFAIARAEKASTSMPKVHFPAVTPLNGPRNYTPGSKCDHPPIRPNEPYYCDICHQSGYDHYARMRPNPKVDPKPEKPTTTLATGDEARPKRTWSDLSPAQQARMAKQGRVKLSSELALFSGKHDEELKRRAVAV